MAFQSISVFKKAIGKRGGRASASRGKRFTISRTEAKIHSKGRVQVVFGISTETMQICVIAR